MKTTIDLPEHAGRRFNDSETGDLMEIIYAERYEYSDTHSVYRAEEVAVAQRVGNTDPDDLMSYALCDTYDD